MKKRKKGWVGGDVDKPSFPTYHNALLALFFGSSSLIPCQDTHCINDLCCVDETLHCSDINRTPGFWESVSRPGGQ